MWHCLVIDRMLTYHLNTQFDSAKVENFFLRSVGGDGKFIYEMLDA